MKRLTSFKYHEPDELAEAISLLGDGGPGTFPLAGGTDLLVRLKREMLKASALVNLKGIERLYGLETNKSDKSLSIGAMTSVDILEKSAAIKSFSPLLSQAAGLLGAPAIRNMATIGGNVGRASPASDLVPALVALGASARIEGQNGVRHMPVEALCLSPGCTVLQPGELFTAFYLPDHSEKTQGGSYQKLGRRKGMDVAMTGAAAWLCLDETGKRIQEIRIALSAVAPTPMRARQAEKIATSDDCSQALIEKAAEVAANEASPCCDLRCSDWYRRDLVKALTKRALMEALGEARKK